MNEDKIKLTRWQVRVEKPLEDKIRALAKKDHRSINQTMIFLAEYYFTNEDIKSKSKKVPSE